MAANAVVTAVGDTELHFAVCCTASAAGWNTEPEKIELGHADFSLPWVGLLGHKSALSKTPDYAG